MKLAVCWLVALHSKIFSHMQSYDQGKVPYLQLKCENLLIQKIDTNKSSEILIIFIIISSTYEDVLQHWTVSTLVQCLQVSGLIQERHNSIANSLELCLSCTNQCIGNDYTAYMDYMDLAVHCSQ